MAAIEVHYIENILDTNYCRLLHLAPFTVSPGVLTVQPSWWNRQTLWTQRELARIFSEIVLVDDVVYGPGTPSEEFWQVYAIVFNGYDAQWWANAQQIVALDDSDVACFMGAPLTVSLVDKINVCLAQWPDTDLFVKTGRCSTKHDVPLRPVRTAQEIVSYLSSSQRVGLYFSSPEVQCKCLYIQPWIEDPQSSEFRVFIVNDHIRGVSQQYFLNYYPSMVYYWSGHMEDIVVAVQRLWAQQKARLPAEQQYKDVVLDIRMVEPDTDTDTDTAQPMRAELIEINAGNIVWGPAGSSLFNTNEYIEFLSAPTHAPIQFRFRVK